MRTRVLLADDHVLILEGIKRIIEETCCDVVGVVSDGRALVEAAERLKPDIVVLDIMMPLLNGIEAVRQIRKQDPHIRSIFLSAHSDADYVREAFRVGASGYVLKRSAIAELATAIREALQGRLYLSPLISQDPVASFLGDSSSPGFGRELTGRQREVLQLLAEGKQTKEMAFILHISPKTVEFHKSGIMDALGLRTTAELTRYAIGQGIAGE